MLSLPNREVSRFEETDEGRARTDTFTLKIESIREDLPECLCYGEGLIRPGTHHTMAGQYLSNDENSESSNGCVK